MFAYCLNNPVMGSDPKGNVPNINLMVTDGGGRAPKFYNNTALPDDDARYHINRLTASGIGVRRWCVEYSGKLNSTEGSNRKLLETAASVGLCIINKPLTSLAGIALPIISYYTNVCKITDEIPDGKYNAYIIKCYGYHDEGTSFGIRTYESFSLTLTVYQDVQNGNTFLIDYSSESIYTYLQLD